MPFESKAILRTTSSKDLSRLSVNAVLLLIADQVFFLAPFVALRRVVHVVGLVVQNALEERPSAAQAPLLMLVAPAPALPTPRAYFRKIRGARMVSALATSAALRAVARVVELAAANALVVPHSAVVGKSPNRVLTQPTQLA